MKIWEALEKLDQTAERIKLEQLSPVVHERVVRPWPKQPEPNYADLMTILKRAKGKIHG